MPTVSFRMDEDEVERLDEEADQEGESRAQYLRDIIHARNDSIHDAAELYQENEELRERNQELEAKVTELQKQVGLLQNSDAEQYKQEVEEQLNLFHGHLDHFEEKIKESYRNLREQEPTNRTEMYRTRKEMLKREIKRMEDHRDDLAAERNKAQNRVDNHLRQMNGKIMDLHDERERLERIEYWSKPIWRRIPIKLRHEWEKLKSRPRYKYG